LAARAFSWAGEGGAQVRMANTRIVVRIAQALLLLIPKLPRNLDSKRLPPLKPYFAAEHYSNGTDFITLYAQRYGAPDQLDGYH
jgi:hypothetical protein